MSSRSRSPRSRSRSRSPSHSRSRSYSPIPEPPFLLKLFCRTGRYHNPIEFADPSSLPRHIPLYLRPTSTLSDVTLRLAAAPDSPLPALCVGTRLVFRLIFRDPSRHSDQPPGYVVKEIGTLVIGAEADTDPEGFGDGAKTLDDVRFIVGDYLSCIILLPSETTGEVAPRRTLRDPYVESFEDGGGARGMAELLGTRRVGGFGRARSDFETRGGLERRGDFNRRIGFDRHRYRDRDMGRGRGGEGGGRGGFPQGEWRRGERLPESRMGSGRDLR
ncbi:Sin3 associated polypeptide p18-domain-containing protein [Cercophora newfieldiana]|uniref:Sin3 associated polypeptide p18-domain-containing protein n=1 Tax=Cercophora newfieldiana TaxID=92897 RepID=A0AA40CPP6_9PEZI|nr:Sin3 associated polypeptide p18-domain-containing protein [Cercophora newfieldiana]